MYIYLDESYNLKDRNKKQFISINGFMALDIAKIRKRWKQARKPFADKKRIHANDKYFNSLRQKAIEIIKTHPAYLITTFQEIQKIPFHKDKKYFIKNKLNFEKIYTDLCKQLLFSLKLNEYKRIVITVDNRKNKASLLGKNKFREEIFQGLKTAYPCLRIEKPRLIPSSSDILLELADFVSNIFYRDYIDNEKGILSELRIKIIQIKNPLK